VKRVLEIMVCPDESAFDGHKASAS